MMFFALLLAAAAAAETPALPPPPAIEVERAGTMAKMPGSPTVITGSAVSEAPFQGRKDVNFPGLFISFEPKARTFWHSHPAGQMLIITSGCGLLESEGSAPLVVKAGDVVWIPPGVKHWHGGSADSAMSHYAMVNLVGGKAIDIMEPVSDTQYVAAIHSASKCPIEK